MRQLSPRWRAALAALILALVAVGLIDPLDDRSDRPPPPRAVPAAVAVDGPDADTRRDDKLPLNAAARDVVVQANTAPERFDLGGNLRGRDRTPAGVVDGPLASQAWPGCKTAFVKSFSSRRGVVPTGIAVHYTGGGNRPGWADLDGLTAYSNNLANQVSWHFGIDREGNCTYNVPLNQKAWTITDLNSQTINIEVVGTGREPDYAGTTGMRKLGEVIRRIGRLHGIPIRLGAVDGACSVTRSGVITHWMGGVCAGAHADIKPYDLNKVIAAIAPAPVTHTDRATCRKLNWYRARRQHPPRPSDQSRRRAIRRRKALEQRGVTCTSRGPVR